jgi:flavin reductase (DIM6/NTAB) family NADH-FMN oxidoreductase RutF/pimeloyl-ACP methyl ester carboxylesterase
MQVIRYTKPAGLTLVADVGGDIDNPGVLLLHGAGESRHVWAALARALVASGRYVVSLDLRGHGDSDFAPDGDYSLDAYRDDVLFVVDSLSAPVDIIGHRVGALIAVASADCVRVGTLVLIDMGFGEASDERHRVRSLLTTAAEGYGDLGEASLRVASQRPSIARQSILGRLLRRGADGRWRWRHDPLAISGPRERRIDLARDVPRITSAARSLRGPTLLIRTGASTLLGPAEADRIKAIIRGLEYKDLAVGQGREGWPAGTIVPTILEFLDRSTPHPPRAHQPQSIDPMALRQAFGCFATGVAILTTIARDGTPIGLTANSFCSVSLDPPLLLFCIDRRAGSLPAFEEADRFAVNVLPSEQQNLSNTFVKKGVDRFENTGWETWEASVPIVQDAMAIFECDKYQALNGGDHRIFIGMVRHIWFDSLQSPLLFFQGKYRSVHPPR